MIRLFLGITAALALPQLALAGKCDSLVKRVEKTTGDGVPTLFQRVIKCDKEEAGAAFDSFLKQSKDVGTVVDLALTAIDAELYPSAWSMMEKIPDYSARDEIAKGVGLHCTDHANVITFLQGGHAALRAIEFSQWDDALVTCKSDDLAAWLDKTVAKPPASSFNEKYNTVLDAYVERNGAGSLPQLQAAAIAAAESGPFSAILEHMDKSVQPAGLGEDVSPEDQKALEEALVAVAQGVDKDNAKLVADRLYNAGAEQAAASLLPVLHADRMKNGALTYGAASVEACDNKAIIHWAEVTEPGKRWSITPDLQGPMRGFKAKLKCDSGEWPVASTPEPVASGAEISALVEQLTAEWTEKGFSVKARGEKAFSLP